MTDASAGDKQDMDHTHMHAHTHAEKVMLNNLNAGKCVLLLYKKQLRSESTSPAYTYTSVDNHLHKVYMYSLLQHWNRTTYAASF